MAPIKKPLGFQLGEVWADALSLDFTTQPGKNAKRFYEDTIDNARIMIKFDWIDNHPAKYREFVDRCKLAHDLGLEVHLCTDWHNDMLIDGGAYHSSLKIPGDFKMRLQCKQMLLDCEPEIFQVCNEPFSRRKNLPRLTEDEYRGYVLNHVIGMKDAGWSGLMLADMPWNTWGSGGEPVRKLVDSWVWETDSESGDNPDFYWDYCAESSHVWMFGDLVQPGDITSTMVHKMTDMNWVEMVVKASPWYKHRDRIGANWPVYMDEVGMGHNIHINSQLGAEYMQFMLEYHKEKRIPLTWLTMGGGFPNWGPDEGWKMHTDLINNKGKLSLGAKAMEEFMANGGTGANAPGRRAACRMIKRVQKLSNADRAAKDAKVRRYFNVWFKTWSGA